MKKIADDINMEMGEEYLMLTKTRPGFEIE